MKKSLVYSIVLVLIFSLSMFYVGGRVEEINLTSPTNVSWTASQTPTFSYLVAGNESTYTCDLIVNDVFMGQNVSAANDTAIYILANDTITPAINLTWYVNCSDGIEINQSPLFLITIDGVAPTSNLVVTDNNTWTTDTTPIISFNVTDNLDSLINYSIIVDGTVVNWTSVANNTPVTYTFETPLSEAAHNIVVEAMDNGGNRTNSSVLLLYVDNTAPMVAVNNTWNNTWSKVNTSLQINFNFSDNLDSVINYSVIISGISYDTGKVANGTEKYIWGFSELPDGQHTLVVEGLDNATNRANSTPVMFYIDTAAPVATITTPLSINTTDTTPTLIFNTKVLRILHALA